jgi:hypothetical protein
MGKLRHRQENSHPSLKEHAASWALSNGQCQCQVSTVEVFSGQQRGGQSGEPTLECQAEGLWGPPDLSLPWPVPLVCVINHGVPVTHLLTPVILTATSSAQVVGKGKGVGMEGTHGEIWVARRGPHSLDPSQSRYTDGSWGCTPLVLLVYLRLGGVS